MRFAEGGSRTFREDISENKWSNNCRRNITNVLNTECYVSFEGRSKVGMLESLGIAFTADK